MTTEKKKTTKKSAKTPLAHAVGRRKKAVARVWLRRGNGKVEINGKDFQNYFSTTEAFLDIQAPFKIYTPAGSYDVAANVTGGGLNAQANAVRLGISRALVSLDEEARPLFRKSGFLTVDPRVKERKKYGQRGARRKFQFVKR